MKQNYFISTQWAEVKRKENQIIILKEANKIGEIPINLIDNLFIFGNINISSGAMHALLKNNVIIIIFYGNLSGKLRGIISSPTLKSNYRNRLKQYSAFNNAQKKHKITKFIVLSKIEQIERFSDLDLTSLKESVLLANTYEELLGYEGKASALFFEYFKAHVKYTFGFKKRAYFPSPDPMNALLSLVYTLYHNVLYSIVLSKGFDPYIGFLHRKRGTHTAFVSDVIEYSRPELTLYVLDLVNNEVLKYRDFRKKHGGYYLKPEKAKEILPKINKEVLTNSKFINSSLVFLTQLESLL